MQLFYGVKQGAGRDATLAAVTVRAEQLSPFHFSIEQVIFKDQKQI